MAQDQVVQAPAAVRQAEINVANARSDTFNILDAAKEKGSPFNTLTVDVDGYWMSGWEYLADGVHYTPPAYKTMGLTGAKNAVTALGL